MKPAKKGFNYIYSREKAQAYQQLSFEQRLEWLEKMNRFLYYFMPHKNKVFAEKLRRGEI